MKLYLEMNSYREMTREPSSNDDWDRGDTSTTWDFGRVSLTKDHFREFDSFETDDFKIGDTIYLVVAVWNTGDTFGWDHQYFAEVMASYKDEKMADEAASMLQNATNSVTLPNNFPLSYIPWYGYFESLSYITVLERVIEE